MVLIKEKILNKAVFDGPHSQFYQGTFEIQLKNSDVLKFKFSELKLLYSSKVKHEGWFNQWESISELTRDSTSPDRYCSPANKTCYYCIVASEKDRQYLLNVEVFEIVNSEYQINLLELYKLDKDAVVDHDTKE